MEKNDCTSFLKNLDKQETTNECLSGIEFPKIVCMSDTKPENITESCMTDKIIFNTPSRSEGEISQKDNFNINTVSLMPKSISEYEFDPNVSESFEPWSIHRTPAKLRGIYVWSPFLKSK